MSMGSVVKRFILVLLSVTILLLSVVYFFVPQTQYIEINTIVNCNAGAASRVINNKWKKIFSSYSDSTLTVDDYRYRIQKVIYNGSQINISKRDAEYISSLSLIQMTPDTSLLQWKAAINVTNNPIEKITAYFKAKELKENMYYTAARLKIKLDNPEYIYGYRIDHTTLQDTVLLFTSHFSQSYPTTDEIYQLIEKVQKYIKENGALETDSPMLNVSDLKNGFMIKVGIPINKELPGNKKLELEPRYLMPMKDKILTTVVYGGEASVKDAYRQIEQYMQDYSMSPPVIPYELLITDRSKEPDTTKWFTRIFYPII